MSGHSKFKKIKHKKGGKDGKRSSNFIRVVREITVAARLGGGDPKMNPRLRMAMLLAKQVNFPKKKIDDAIKKGVNPNEGEVLEDVRYEGFGPSGIAVLVEGVSNSTQVRMDRFLVHKSFVKNGGTLGEVGCVAHLFQRLGLITYPANVKPEEEMFMLAVDHGAEDCQKVVDEYEILCSFDHVHGVRDEIEKTLGEPSSVKLIWKPNKPVVLDKKKTKSALTFLDTIEELECVQNVWSNLEVPDDYYPDEEYTSL